MKKCIVMAFAAMLFAGTTLLAQTTEEILGRMSTEMERGNTEGFSIDLNMKIPIVGTVTSHNMILGDKMKFVITSDDKSSIMWSDATTTWSYDEKTGEITIENKKPTTDEKKDDDNMNAFNNITDGYDLTLKKETSDAWYIVCKKSKSNKDKDDPKKMELTVSKATYLPISLRTKQSLITISIENYTLGVSEESVTFNPAEYPNATIIDKR